MNRNKNWFNSRLLIDFSIMRRLIFFGMISLFAAFSGCGSGSENPQRVPSVKIKNVILITVDTLRADHLGLYGAPLPVSPTIDRMGRQSVQFIRCITQIPKTGPSLTSMLTSTLPERNRVFYNEQIIEEHLAMLPGQLKKAGYYTTGIQVNNVCRSECGFGREFDAYLQTCRPGKAQQPGTSANLTNRVVIPWIRKHAGEKFFLWVHYLDPHGPYAPPAPFPEFFTGEAHTDIAPVPISKTNNGLGVIPKYQAVINSNKPEDYIDRYNAEIRFWDHCYVDVLKTLEETGLSDNTLVILSADHGESLIEHNYFFEHGAFLYEQCLVIPAIWRFPDRKQRLVPGQISLLDFAPTILKLVGAPPLPEARGVDITPCLLGYGPAPKKNRILRSSSPILREYGSTGIISGDWKYIHYADQNLRTDELFNFASDPQETYNVIAQFPRQAEALKKEVVRRTRDPKEYREPVRAPRIESRMQVKQLKALGYLD